MCLKRRPGSGLVSVPGLILISAVALLPAQTAGTITGKVLLEQTGAPMHNAEVLTALFNPTVNSSPRHNRRIRG